MALPKKSKGITTSAEECQFVFYGPPGIGKSESAASFPDVCFISTTRGLGHIDVPEVIVKDWEDFLECCADIAEGGHGYRVFCVDLLRDLYDYCVEFVMAEELGGRHPSDFDWGKGWGAVGKEFKRAIGKLMNEETQGKHYGMIYICHDTTKEMKTKTYKVDKLMPALTDSTFRWLFGIVDFMIYMVMEQFRDGDGDVVEHRVMHLRPSTQFQAKSWVKGMPDRIVFESSETNKTVYELLYEHMTPAKAKTKKRKR